MKWLGVLLLVALTALRIWAAHSLPIEPREAYHWMCANQLEWAFFDGPGGTAALVKAGILAIGDNALGLRLAFPLLAALATIGAFLAGQRVFGESGGIWAAVSLNVIPAFNEAAVYATPAVPLVAAGLFAAWCAMRAFESSSALDWLAFGVFSGIGSMFAYIALLLLPAAFLAAAFSPNRRPALRGAGIYLGAVVAVAMTLPAFLWNQQHSWPALALGTLRTALTPRWSEIPHAAFEMVTAVSIAGSIWLIAVIAFLFAGARQDLVIKRLAAFLTPVFLLVLYCILHGSIDNSAVLMTAALIFIGSGYPPTLGKGVGVAALAAVVISAGFSAAAMVRPADSATALPWGRIGKSIGDLLSEVQETPFVIAKDPDDAAMLNYQLPRVMDGRNYEVFLRESQDLSNQFGLWPRYDAFVETLNAPDEMFRELKAKNPYLGRSALYVTDEGPASLPQTIRGAFGNVVPFADISIDAGAERVLHVYLCEEYQTMPL